jgi:DNA-binding IclR family transcriptional regulator
MTQYEEILAVIQFKSESTGTDISTALGLAPEEVFTLLTRLLKTGKVRREGAGGKKDPFRYFLKVPL